MNNPTGPVDSSRKRVAQKTAIQTALAFLEIRPRSVHEMRTHLSKKGFPQAVIDDVVTKLSQNDYLNDKNFAEAWVLEKQVRKHGPRRIHHELLNKGIDRELIEQVLAALVSEENIQELAAEKLTRLNEPDPRRAYQRLSRFLIQRGFTPELVHETCRDLMKDKYGQG